jgi:diguanylate cyclase (GGDEF)-like protein
VAVKPTSETFGQDSSRPVSPNYTKIAQLVEHLTTDINTIYALINAGKIPTDESWRLETIYDHQSFLLEEIIRQARELETENRALWTINLLDELTGLICKRHMLPMMTKDLSERRHDDSLNSGSLIVMDINNMKGLNADFGHFETDEILAQLTKLAKIYLRDNDRAFRFGGDEFVLFLRGANAREGAKLIARRILSHLSRSPIKAIRSQDQEMEEPPKVDVRISFCLGAASLPEKMPEPEDEEAIKRVISSTLRRADTLLYTAKHHSGSEQTVIAYKNESGEIILETEEDIIADRT